MDEDKELYQIIAAWNGAQHKKYGASAFLEKHILISWGSEAWELAEFVHRQTLGQVVLRTETERMNQ